MSLSVSQQHRYPPHWHVNLRYLRAGLRRGGNTHTENDVLEMWRKDKAQWWATPYSFVLTVIIDYPRKRRIRCELAGGSLLEILTYWEPQILAWAKQQGCDEAEFSGRRGWRRVMQPGWKFLSEQCVFEL